MALLCILSSFSALFMCGPSTDPAVYTIQHDIPLTIACLLLNIYQ